MDLLIPRKKDRLEAFDNARALCMLYIVGWWHLQSYSDFELPIAFNNFNDVTYGVLGLFMFISGFFLSRKRMVSLRDVLVFYEQRFIRIWPLFFLACTAFLFRIGGG